MARDPESSSVVVIDPEILGGEPVFVGTRVPVKTLADYLLEGASIDAFLDDFPTVTRVQVARFLDQARRAAVASAEA
jgi:uncharacterized protein (DUF433 family)